MMDADWRADLLLAKCLKRKGDLNRSLELLLKLYETLDNSDILYLIAEIYKAKGC